MRTIVFIDGQNLYHLARTAWAGMTRPERYTWPSYDVGKLSQALTARAPGRALTQIRFYTGVPDPRTDDKSRFRHGFWTNKLRAMRNQRIVIYTGRINPGGQEKGVDVKIAIDLIDLAYRNTYDFGIIVSQDWDFGSAVHLAKTVAGDQSRTVGFESAFPYDNNNTSSRGIPGATWVHIDKALYDSCLDHRDYRPPVTRT